MSFTWSLGGSLLGAFLGLGLGFAFGPRGGRGGSSFPFLRFGQDVVEVLDARHVAPLLLLIHVLQDVRMIPDFAANRVRLETKRVVLELLVTS